MPIQICFVCLGNICRSPTAEGIMHSLLMEHGLESQVTVDSAGTGAWHIGEPADSRSRDCAKRQGVTLTSSARQVTRDDFDRFDLLLAMDRENYADLIDLAPSAHRSKVRLFLSFQPEADRKDVPDPYFGGPGGFDNVYEICVTGCLGLLSYLRDHYPLSA